ncbi:MAG: glycosyltransferase family 4 protein, partial [Candidatus Krumholzibacteria bacterium]|nr:glycosyltransferase family 4 protein [Candidatus Krumholzibacteria bacterium]
RSTLQMAREALRTIYGLEARRGLELTLDHYRPQIAHLHNIYHQLSPSILRPLKDRSIPVILTLHDFKLLCPTYSFLRQGKICEECPGKANLPLLAHRCWGESLPASLVLWLEDRLHRFLRSYEEGVSVFTAPSRFYRDRMKEGRLKGLDVRYLPNFLPFGDHILDSPFVEPPRKELPELLWVGRMSEEKGLHTLLQALAREQLPLRLSLAGDGPAEPSLRELSAELGLGDRVRFLGRIGREEVPQRILESDGTILPSEWYENAPISVLESMALGRPVLASRIGGVPEMVVEGKSGWLFEAGNKDSLLETLGRWSADREASIAVGRSAYDMAREKYHPRVVLKMVLELYRELGS